MSDSDNTKDWDEIEALRASLREHMAEIKRLNECLTWEQHRVEHISTHGPGCAMWGPKHYECLLRAYNAMKERTSQESRQVEPFGYFQYSMHLDAWVQNKECNKGIAFYTAPPKREPLTDEEIETIFSPMIFARWAFSARDLARAIEQAHGIRGEE